MTPEALNPELPNNQVEIARQEFNRVLLDPVFDGHKIINSLLQLQNTLYRPDSNLKPDELFHELALVSQQAVEKAVIHNNRETQTILKNLQQGYAATRDNFAPIKSPGRQETPKPTQTDTLPPMTSAKGAKEVAPPEPENETAAIVNSQEIKLTKRQQELYDLLKQTSTPLSKEDLAEKLHVEIGTIQAYLSTLKLRGVKIESVKENEQSLKVVGYQLVQEEIQNDNQGNS